MSVRCINAVPIAESYSEGSVGLFRLSERVYRKAPGANKSSLDVLAERSPAHLAEERRSPRTPTDAMEFGTLVHGFILEPEAFPNSYYIKPETYTNDKGETKPWNANAKVCRKWVQEHADKPVITREREQAIPLVANAVANHPTAGPMLAGALREMSAFATWQWDPSLLLKGRLDLVNESEDGTWWILDLKVMDDAGPGGFPSSCASRRYHVQAAFYSDLFERLFAVRPEFRFIAVESKPPFAVKVWRIHPLDLEMGRREYERDLLVYRQCMESGIWPGYPQEEGLVEFPSWYRRAHAA